MKRVVPICSPLLMPACYVVASLFTAIIAGCSTERDDFEAYYFPGVAAEYAEPKALGFDE